MTLTSSTPRIGRTPQTLEVRDLSLKFKGVNALTDVTFTVEPGELFAVIGPNGAGKTSLLNCITSAYRPSTGTVRFGGESITGLMPHKVAHRGVARTFQNVELFSNLTVLDNLLLGRHQLMQSGVLASLVYFGKSRAEEREHRYAVEEILEFLNMESIRNHPVSDLPYGFQKKVEIGRALAMGPRLLLLDEPVAGMNLEESEDIARLIVDISVDLGTSIILVEHDMPLVMDLAQKVLVLNFGHVIAQGTPEAIQADPAVIEAYLGQEGVLK